MFDKEIFSRQWCDQLFADRNRAYGAYQLRRQIGSRYRRAILIVFGMVFAFLLLYGIHLLITFQTLKSNIEELQEAMNFEELKPLDEHEFKRVAQGRKAVEHAKTGETMAKPEISDEVEETIIFDLGVNEPEEEIAMRKDDETLNDVDPVHNVGEMDMPIEAPVLLPSDVVKEMPMFPGGPGALMKWLDRHIPYQNSAIKRKIEGDMEVAFIVDKNGNATDARVTKSLDPQLDRIVLSAIQSMPKWTPGKVNGQVSIVQITLPIHFEIRK